ncbi:MAG TPA: NADP-dependent phosphogluconate dehydrogenase, partial [Galbitalea sp.]|nr:NADP-dependent phosphogluconate dehydrogenase [Galbitalea sp.]
GIPVSGIAEAVFARALSSKPEQRKAASDLPGPSKPWKVEDKTQFVEDVRRALYASKMIAYSQGFDAIVAGAEEFNWDIKKGNIAKIWRGGCIIRAQFLNRITDAYEENPKLVALLTAPYFKAAIEGAQESWRTVVAHAAMAGIPTPAFSSSLAYYDGIRAERLPAALVQGQRDFFGAHTYQRVDKPGIYHTLWSGDRSEIETEGSSH